MVSIAFLRRSVSYLIATAYGSARNSDQAVLDSHHLVFDTPCIRLQERFEALLQWTPGELLVDR
jgi:hypothetical protein